MRKRIKTALFIISGILIFSGAGVVLADFTRSLAIPEIAASLGFWGPVFLTLGIAVGGIIVPLTSLPFLLAGMTVYGFWPTFVMYYVGNSVIAPCADFLIARRFGRPAVARFAGAGSVKQIDRISDVVGFRVLAVLRFTGGILHDSVSYAVGLTDMDFRKYLLLTFTLPAPGMLLMLFLLGKGLTENPLYLALIALWGYGAGILTSYIILREYRTLRRKSRARRLKSKIASSGQ